MQWWELSHWVTRSRVRSSLSADFAGGRPASVFPFPIPHSCGSLRHWVYPFCVMFWESILLDCNGYNLPACFTLQLQVCICWHNFFLGQTWETHMIILRRRKWFRTHTDTTHRLYMLATKNNRKSKTTSTNKSTVSWCKSKEIRNPLSPSQTPEL